MKQMSAMFRIGLVGSAILWAGCSTAPKEPDSEAYQTLRRMSDALAGAPSFSYEVVMSADKSGEDMTTVRLSRRSRVLLARPDRLFVSVSGDDGDRALWFKGPSLTILERGDNEYATVKVPGKIDKMLDYAMREHGLTVPLADLAFSSPYDVLTAAVETATHLGTDLVDGCETDHLLFTQENVDWEIWIDTGDAPLPRKIVITQKLEPGSPQFTAVLSKWDLKASPDADTFEFRPPQGARKVSMRELIEGERGDDL